MLTLSLDTRRGRMSLSYRVSNGAQSMPRWVWILLAVVALGWWMSPSLHSDRTRSPGILAPDTPQQVVIAHPQTFALKEFEVTPLAHFEITARVLSRADYRLDAESSISPTDLALGWGRMSDSGVLDRLRIRQSARWYTYHWDATDPPIPLDEIIRSSSNMHMIPADKTVAAMLRKVRPGDEVHLSGELIQAKRKDGAVWRSSMSRTDTGDGACEVVYVQSLVLM